MATRKNYDEEIMGAPLEVETRRPSSMVKSFADYRDQAHRIDDATFAGRDKDRLIDHPFVVVSWEAKYSDNYGADIAVMTCIDADDKIFKIVDAGSGIYRQLVESTGPEGFTPIYCERGLRKSVYVAKSTGLQATTYYLS